MQEVAHKYAAGGVVIHDGKVLTISSALRDSVSLPKGHIERDESPEATAVREVKEETGYDAAIVGKAGTYTYEFDWTDGNHYIKTVTYYAMELTNDDTPQSNLQEGEDFEVHWLDVDQAMKLFTFDEARDALKRTIEQYPLTNSTQEPR